MSKFYFSPSAMHDVLIHGPSGVVVARISTDGSMTSMTVFETAKIPRDFDRDDLPPIHNHYSTMAQHRGALLALVSALDAVGGYDYLPGHTDEGG